MAMSMNRFVEQSSSACMGMHDVKSMLQRFIYNRSEEAFSRGDCARDLVTTIEEHKGYKAGVRKAFIESIGGLPTCDTPLNPRITGTIQFDGCRMEKLIFESRPQNYVTANIYIPDGLKAPTGAVILIPGHSLPSKATDNYQVYCMMLTRVGFVVFVHDTVGQGERFGYYEPSIDKKVICQPTYEHDYAGHQALLLGDSIARYFVHDIMRSIDYLYTRHEVDPSRIAITGASGGGTQTCMMMMCDDRLATAAPSNFLMNRRTYMYSGGAQDQEQIWPSMTAKGFDHEDFLICMAPRPVIVNCTGSDFFPIEGTRRTVEKCRRFWEMYGKGNLLRINEDWATHSYTFTLMKNTVGFFTEHFYGESANTGEILFKPETPEKLWCTSQGNVKRDFTDACFVYEENLKRLGEIKASNAMLGDCEKRKTAVEWLTGRVFHDRSICDINPRLLRKEHIDGLECEQCIWWSQEYLYNHAFVLKDIRFATACRLPVTIAVWNGGTADTLAHIDWIMDECASGRVVLVLDVSGVGVLTPNPVNPSGILDNYGTIHKLGDDLYWLDDSLAAMRTYEVTRAVDFLQKWMCTDSSDVHLYGYGRYGIYAGLAALLDERVKKCMLDGKIKRFEDITAMKYYNSHDIKSIIIPGILKYLDIPDLNRWLAADGKLRQ